MGHQYSYLFKRTFVEQKVYTFTGSELAFLVLAVNAILTAAQLGFCNLVLQLFYLFLHLGFNFFSARKYSYLGIENTDVNKSHVFWL